MSNVNNPSGNDSNEQAKDEQMKKTGEGIDTDYVIVQGSDTLQELNKQVHQIKLDKLKDLYTMCRNGR